MVSAGHSHQSDSCSKLSFEDIEVRITDGKSVVSVCMSADQYPQNPQDYIADDIWTGVMGSGPRILCTSFGLQS